MTPTDTSKIDHQQYSKVLCLWNDVIMTARTGLSPSSLPPSLTSLSPSSLLPLSLPPSLPQYRGEVLDCLRKVVAGLGSSSSTVHRDIYKAVRNGLTDKAPHVRSSAAKVYTPSSSTPLSVSGIISNCNTQLQLIVFLIFCGFVVSSSNT